MALRNLVGGDDLFFHPDVINFYNEVIEKWENNGKRIALFLGCTLHKPYSKSFMHKKIIGLIQKHNLDDKVQQFIIGEPLVICPREWENRYPAAHYEFHPNELTKKGKKIFIHRLRIFIEKAVQMHEIFIVFAPNHHKEIFLKAARGLVDPIVVPYNLYNLPLLLKQLKGAIK